MTITDTRNPPREVAPPDGVGGDGLCTRRLIHEFQVRPQIGFAGYISRQELRNCTRAEYEGRIRFPTKRANIVKPECIPVMSISLSLSLVSLIYFYVSDSTQNNSSRTTVNRNDGNDGCRCQ